MGKKRKAGYIRAEETGSEEEGRERKTRLGIRTFEDIATSEDEFHLNRDKVLLEDSPARRRRRKVEAHGLMPAWFIDPMH